MIFHFLPRRKAAWQRPASSPSPVINRRSVTKTVANLLSLLQWWQKRRRAETPEGKNFWGNLGQHQRVGSLSIDLWLPQQPGVRPPPLVKSWVHQSSTHRAQLVHNAPLPSDRNTCFVYLSVRGGEFPATLWAKQHTEPQPNERRP